MQHFNADSQNPVGAGQPGLSGSGTVTRCLDNEADAIDVNISLFHY